MERIWIIGLGQFGSRALQKLSSAAKNRTFTVVDSVKDQPDWEQEKACEFVNSDGVSFLIENLQQDKNEPDWIVPALPLHLAAEWCLGKLGPDQACRLPIPESLYPRLPNPVQVPSGDICLSFAHFRCPDDCPEPSGYCTVTGEERTENMFDFLSKLSAGQHICLVLRSHQLAPGVGGFRPDQLFSIWDKVQQTPGKYLISTACRCHGVITCLQRF